MPSTKSPPESPDKVEESDDIAPNSFERFKKLAKSLIAVPRAELAEAEEEWQRAPKK